MQKTVMCVFACMLSSFLLGSIPWGLIISRIFYRTDIRQLGSGNIGATNAARTLGAVGGLAVLVLDCIKGMAAGGISTVLAAMAAINTEAMDSAASPPALDTLTTLTTHESAGTTAIFGIVLDSSLGAAALNVHIFGLIVGLGVISCICGHVFSPWLGFKGGKGIAVAAGCLFFVFGPLGFTVLVTIFAIGAVSTRYVSVGSIGAAVSAPFIAWWVSQSEVVFTALICCAASLVIWAHRKNIARLRAGNENRFGIKKKEAA